MKIVDHFYTSKGLVIGIPFFENFESILGKKVIQNGKVYLVKEIQRNRCNGFGQYKTEKEWEERDLYLLVEEIE